MKRILTTIFLFSILLVPAERVSASGRLSPWAVESIDLMNQERQSRGLTPLSVNAKLEDAAAAKLADMETEDYFAHTSPEQLTPWSFIEGVGYEYRYAGENLAIHFKNPAAEHDAWMRSEKHCQNILDPRFREVGVAVKNVFFEGRETMLAVSMFGTESGVAVDPSATKETALALCRGEMPAVSGATDEKNGSGDGKVAFLGGDIPVVIGAVASVWNRLGADPYRTVQTVAVVMFSMAELLAVYVVSLAFLARERREGVFPS